MKVYDLFWIIFLWCGLFLKPLLNLLQFCFWIFVLIFYLWGIWDFSSLPGTESIPLTLEIQILTLDHQGSPVSWFLSMMESMVEVGFFVCSLLHLNVQYFYFPFAKTQNTVFSTLNCLSTLVWAYLFTFLMPTPGCLDYNIIVINHNFLIFYKCLLQVMVASPPFHFLIK